MDGAANSLDKTPNQKAIKMPLGDPLIPQFYLYGEPHRAVDQGFLHAESLDDRSRPSEWRIQPHAHAELTHLLFLGTGGGTLTAEGMPLALVAPTLLLVPARTVHGFDFTPESRGWIVTVATSYLRELALRHGELAEVLRLGVAALDTVASRPIEAVFERLMRELAWAAPGHRAASEALLIELLVAWLRAAGLDAPQQAPGRQAALVARLRERIESRFRLRESIAVHAAALGVSVSTLRAACAAVAGQSPNAMLDARAMLEARRALLYSTLKVSEIAYSLGFGDPAYFARFFARHSGAPPSAYRRAN
jgi:AraC family transcriptional activator of pobA